MLKRTSILLAFAFTGLLTIIGAAAVAIWYGAGSAQREVNALHSTHLAAGDALATIRANVFLAGILTRDYLLDPDPSTSARYAAQFDTIRNDTDRSFRTLVASSQGDEERRTLNELRKEVSGYWDPTTTALNWTSLQKAANRTAFLQDRIRHREEIVELAGRVEQLMSANFAAEKSRITSANARFESSLGWTTGVALLLALGIAGATLARMISLEHQSATAEMELRRLSGQIRMAQEQERRFLSRELHDQAGQMLTGLRMELASLSRNSSEDEFTTRVSHAKGIVDQTLRVIRNIAMLLRPSMLDDLGLASALGWLVRDITRSGGMEIHAEIDPDIDSLPDAQCTCTYRVVQEALTNAARHSGGRNIDLTVSADDGGVSGAVVDDGQGFHVAAAKRAGAGYAVKGLGLIGMEERIRELGGTLRVSSAPGRGTRVEFRLPRPQDPSPGPASDSFAAREEVGL